ncbi:MAG TPA: XdhC family protein [Thermoanaerobaculia bacterium]
MKHWKETGELLGRAVRLAESGRGAAIATVVAIERSAYRRPGAKYLVEADGETAGSISGGCLEADVREIALAIAGGAPPRLVRYDTGGDDGSPFGLGLGCSGAIDIFVQRFGTEEREFARAQLELLSGDAPFAVGTVLGGEAAGRAVVVSAAGARTGTTGQASLDAELAAAAGAAIASRESRRQKLDHTGADVFVEVLDPPPHLVIFGAGDDAMPLCAFSSAAGFRVTVVDHREATLEASRFPGAWRRVLLRPEDGTGSLPLGPRALAVVKTHSFGVDREWMRRLLAAGVRYAGLLGPRARAKEILTQIGADEETARRVYAPVGLDLGAEGPEQVALSIVAELLAFHASREPASLRGKTNPIHAV